MSHYDSCREAEERIYDENRGIRFKASLQKMTDEQAGQLRGAVDEVFALVRKMNGTADQHRSIESYRKQIEAMLK